MKFRKYTIALLVLTLGVTGAQAKKKPQYELNHPLTPEEAALVEKAIAREKVIIQAVQQRTPLVETYIQNTKPDQKLYLVPVQDEYMLNRIDFSKVFFDKTFTPRETKSRNGFFKGSANAFAGLGKALGLDKHLGYNPLGFAQMMFVDPYGFDSSHYTFRFVRREFIGSVRTWVYDVHPSAKVSGPGRFYGRIWVEDQAGNIVRFNGTYTHPNGESSKLYFHFDSWRVNVQPDIWLPVAVYVEETQRMDNDKAVGLKAQTHFWGYSLKLPTRESENVSVKVEDAVDKSDDAQDVSPLQATRNWVTQAENNVIDRLVEAGLVAPLAQNGFESTVLDQIVVNLEVPNNVNLTDPVHCRVLLSTTVEATTVGNTILLSKGLIDALPNEEAIASVISLELAHIVMGHHIDTRYAFNDRLLFPDESSFQRIDMYHNDHDNTEASKQAFTYLQASMYKDRLGNAGLFWTQLAERGKALKALNSPKLGDSLLRADGTPWMAELAHQAPKITWEDLTQFPALPLGSWLKTDPWDDKVHMINAKRVAPLNPRDKMPLEVTPLFFKLQRYDASKLNPAAATAPAATAPASQPAPQQPENAPAAAPADQPAPQPANPPSNDAPVPAPAPANGQQ